MKTAKCPICEEKIILSKKVELLNRHSCPICKALLEVVNIDPLELDWIYYDEYYDSEGMAQRKNPKEAKCPICREDVSLGSQAKIGGRLLCQGCDSRLEIVSLFPAELDMLYDGGYENYFRGDDSYEERFNNYAN
ncbi:MAG: hypothetical protein JJE12_04770 [Anaerolineales bacterium]|nr:hypothetical protein [Anaerolineales bacterium]